MITDINSLVSGQAKGSLTTSTTSNLGALSKLSSELKFIEGMHPVKITSVQNAQSAQGANQLIGIQRNDQQQFTLVNPKPDANIRAGDNATLTVARNQSASLTLTSNNARPTVAQGSTSNPLQSSPAAHQNNQTSTTTKAADTNMTAYQASASRPSASPNNTNVSTNAKVLADVTIASRPITLTVISSNAPSQAATSATPTTSTAVASTAMSTTSSPVQSAPSATQINSANNTATSSPSSSAQANGYSALVSDGKQQFTLNTQHPLKAGDTVNVFVDKNNQLQLYPSQRPSSTEVTLSEGLKQALPKQITAQEFVGMIRQLNQMTQAGSALPEKVSQALEQLVRQLPNLQSVTQSSEGIKQALQSSGLFSEANLAQRTHLNTDLKLNLSRLENAVADVAKQPNPQPIPATQANTFNLVSGAIERITTGQVRHLVENAQAQQDGTLLPLSMEIPIKDGRASSVVNVKIDKDHSQSSDTEPHQRRWLVQLKFDFEETGRFEARTSIQGQKVGIVFAVEEAATEAMIRQRLDELRSNLRNKDVSIETLDCFRAKLKDPTSSSHEHSDQPPKRLIDIRT
ncbi:flagellar hook-length control protein FliK [Marinomonas ostreistagni]|uniref:flagellar hook-length control protein FliK n=1 Tax=Marinomonas ostreistagni TaxID=359209 RepID=UPI00194DC201|nr:flagellar hook-length control protein FliK [Marinomonas ostreistagni]MBM6551274.1 flagellar hook-length control protein FliK [Marinomonas ostreistagni]